MSEHTEIALDRLRVADDIEQDDHLTPERLADCCRREALVHAVLDVADAIRSTGMSSWSALDALAPRQP